MKNNLLKAADAIQQHVEELYPAFDFNRDLVLELQTINIRLLELNYRYAKSYRSYLEGKEAGAQTASVQ